LHLVASFEDGAMLRPRRAFLSRDPNIAFYVHLDLECLAPLRRELGNPRDATAGAQTLGPLQHRDLTGENGPPFAIARPVPDQDASSGELDGIGRYFGSGLQFVAGAQRGGYEGREKEAEPHAISRTDSGLVALSHASSQGTTRRFCCGQPSLAEPRLNVARAPILAGTRPHPLGVVHFGLNNDPAISHPKK
jgi:hypothetical protein